MIAHGVALLVRDGFCGVAGRWADGCTMQVEGRSFLKYRFHLDARVLSRGD